MTKMWFCSLHSTHFKAFFRHFWKFCMKYEKIQFFCQKFHILWPTTQKPTLMSENSKISCLDPISTPSGHLWISKNSKFPILSFYFRWILNIHTLYFWGVIVSTPSQDFWFFGSAARCVYILHTYLTYNFKILKEL